MSFVRLVRTCPQNISIHNNYRLVLCVAGVYSMFLVSPTVLIPIDGANSSIQLWAIAQERRMAHY